MKRNKVFLGLIILVLGLVALALSMLYSPKLQYLVAKPASYSECVSAKGAILESYPTQCVFHGHTFTNPEQGLMKAPAKAEDTKTETPTDTATGPDLGAKLVTDTSGWELFTNNARGYTIKYPKDWILETVNLDTGPVEGKPVRYLKFTSPNKKYMLTVGIKKSAENVLLSDNTEGPYGDNVSLGQLTVAGTSFPLFGIKQDSNSSAINQLDYYNPSSSNAELGVKVKDYLIRATLVALPSDADIAQAPELAIANSILASLTLTK